jgi:hypothetical protein
LVCVILRGSVFIGFAEGFGGLRGLFHSRTGVEKVVFYVLRARLCLAGFFPGLNKTCFA